MNAELIGALEELEKGRGIPKQVLLEAIEAAIVSAYKRHSGANSASSVRVEIDGKSGVIRVYSRKVVTDDLQDDTVEIELEEARRINDQYAVGDIVEQEVTPKDFGRIAAQTAKQMVIQRIREAERTAVFDEFANRAGDVIYGSIVRQESRNTIVDLGRVEGVLPANEVIPGERYVRNTRMKFYIVEVKQSTKGPQIILSRSHTGLLKHLFEREVPEIESGIVEIKSVAREAGFRSKVSVYSRNENVDAVGACVGSRGIRIQTIVHELNGEKIDIVQWVTEPEDYIANALSPAKVSEIILNDEVKAARAVVDESQLSLAIGKEGQNVRLAARLTGFRIDIKSIEQMEAILEAEAEEMEIEEELQEEELVEETMAKQAEDEQTAAPALPIEDTAETPEEEAQETEEPSTQTQPELEQLSSLSNVEKRKSWEQRFGGSTQAQEQQPSKSSPGKDGKAKKKKGKKVIKDLSMLASQDFGFDKED